MWFRMKCADRILTRTSTPRHLHFVPLLSWRQLHNIITNSGSHPKAVKQRGGSGTFWPGLPHFGCKFAEIPQQLVKFLILIAFFSIFFGLLNCTSHGKCDRLWVIRIFARIVPGWVGISVRKRAARPAAIRETKPPRKKRRRPYHLLSTSPEKPLPHRTEQETAPPQATVHRTPRRYHPGHPRHPHPRLHRLGAFGEL